MPTIKSGIFSGICYESDSISIESFKIKLSDLFRDKVISYARGQVERCPTTNRLHIQFLMQLSCQKTINQVAFLIGVNKDNLEPVLNYHALMNYVWKEDTRVHGTQFEIGIPRKSGQRTTYMQTSEKIKSILDVFQQHGCGLEGRVTARNTDYSNIPLIEQTRKAFREEQELDIKIKRKSEAVDFFKSKAYTWQLVLFKMLQSKESNDRVIYWIVGKGNSGKSTFQRYYNDMFFESTCCLTKDKPTNLKHRVSKQEDVKVIFMNYPKAFNKYNIEDVDYTTLEEFKDRMFVSGKYESTSVHWDTSPHVIVFSNSVPDFKKLSADRFIIGTIEDNKSISWKAIPQDKLDNEELGEDDLELILIRCNSPDNIPVLSFYK